MNENTKRALDILNENGYTLVIYGGAARTDRRRGVTPLLEIADKHETLKGSSAADKVIGKAAAYLYVLLEIEEVYAHVISRGALEVLSKYGISCEYGTVADAIRNRDNTGFCPMETAVLDASTPEEALIKIKQKLQTIKKQES